MGFIPRSILEESSPSRQHGIDLHLEATYRWSYCEFLKDAGMELKMPQLTIATAAVFCHRFFACHSHGEPLNDRFVRTHPSTRVCDVYPASPLFCSTESSSWLVDDSNRVSLFSGQGRGNSKASQGGRSSVVPDPAQARV